MRIAAIRLLAAAGFAAAGSSCTPAAPATRPGATPAPPSAVGGVTLGAAESRWVDSVLASLSLRQRVGQMVMVWTLGDYTSTEDPTFVELKRWVEKDGVGGMTMSLGTPMEVATKLNEMQRAARVPLLVSSDLEPGLGRLESGMFTHYLLETGGASAMPPAMAIAATGREADAYDAARVIAREGRAVGIHMNFAPVVDVNNNPSNPVINTRSFGEDPHRVALLSAAFVRGTQDGGMLATAKHFPGHGDTDVDSHAGMPVVSVTRARLDSVELIPFRAAINAGTALIMTAHIALPALDSATIPATLSPAILTGLLRDSLGFRGLTVTDALTMEGIGRGYTPEQSAVLAVKAGASLLLKPSDPTRAIDGVVAAVERGEISRGRIDSAARNILALKARVGLNRAAQVDLQRAREIVGSAEHRRLAAGIASRAITVLRDTRTLLPLRDSGSVLVVQYAPETELKAGRQFPQLIRAGRTAASRARGAGAPATPSIKISPAATRDLLDSLSRVADRASAIVIATYVRRVEGEGRTVVPAPIAAWIDSLARRRPVVVVSFGNPYLIRQFPGVSSYVTTYGVSDDLERAAARVLLGQAPATGRSPVSLPGFFRAGDGISRP
jgi:beta-N-acetylhexosaminidase